MSKIWVGDILYEVEDEVSQEIMRLRAERNKLDAEIEQLRADILKIEMLEIESKDIADENKQLTAKLADYDRKRNVVIANTKPEGACMSNQYAPSGDERGTSLVYKQRADPKCTKCNGFGEYHVPYEDYDTFIIHRCDCTDNDMINRAFASEPEQEALSDE